MFDEGFSDVPYRCPGGYLTIGYGRNLQRTGLSKEEISFLVNKDMHYDLKTDPNCDKEYIISVNRNFCDFPLSEKEGIYLLSTDIERIYYELNDKFTWFKGLSSLRKEVVMNMTYNLGFRGFSKFKRTIYYIEKKMYLDASKEMLDSLWARQVGPRATRLSKRMLKGKT